MPRYPELFTHSPTLGTLAEPPTNSGNLVGFEVTNRLPKFRDAEMPSNLPAAVPQLESNAVRAGTPHLRKETVLSWHSRVKTFTTLLGANNKVALN